MFCWWMRYVYSGVVPALRRPACAAGAGAAGGGLTFEGKGLIFKVKEVEK